MQLMANRLEAVIYPFQPARGLTTELKWDRAEQHDENDWGLNDAGSPKNGKTIPNPQARAMANLSPPYIIIQGGLVQTT